MEVLLTAPDEREPFRKTDVVSFGCQGHFIGQGPQGYLHACAYLAQLLRLDGTPPSPYRDVIALTQLALSVTACAVPPLPKGEALAVRQSLRFCQRLPLWGSWRICA